MSYFDDASLVMIPSGYKTSKVYSVKPTDGTGDLTFTRSNDTATRVGPNGLIEKVRTNLSKNSQTGASWTASGSTVDSTTAADFLGGNDAVTYTATGVVAGYVFADSAVSVNAGSVYTGSVYVKNVDANYVQLTFSTSGFGASQYQNFDLTTGTLGSGLGIDGKIKDVGGGWYRISLTASPILSVSTAAIVVVIAPNASASRLQAATAGQTLTAFGIQLETGDIATDYIATTSAAVSVGPVASVPRLDYLNSSCPRLLLEPQRTNSQTYSEQINNAAWGLSGVTVSANNATSPDGYTNADKIVETASSARHEFYGVVASFSGNNAVSFFAKDAGRRYICALEPTGAGGATFDLQTGTVSAVTAVSASIENYGNGWYRCSVIINKTASTQIYYVLRTNGSVGIETYTGDGTSGVLFYGAQTELNAAYPTSYIPTLGAAVTRGADACSKTGISSLIGQTEGVVFFDYVMVRESASTSEDFYPITISDGTSANMITLNNYNNSLLVYISSGGSAVFVNSSFSGSSGLRIKAAIAYKANDFAFYVNGVQIATDTSGAVPIGLSQLNVNTYFTGANIDDTKVNQLLLFKTRLTNAQLAELTTL